MFKYIRNSNIFNIIDTEEKVYWLGFLYADGYVDEKDYIILLGLKRDDRQHLEKFQKFLESDVPIKDRVNNGGHLYSYIRIYDQKIVKDLINLGLYKKKSLTLLCPNNDMIPTELIFHFIRGYFDGDGSIYPVKNSKYSIKYRMSICGTESILLYIQDKLKITKKLDYNRSCPKFVIAAKQQVIDNLNLLYQNANIYLERKYQLYQTVLIENSK